MRSRVSTLSILSIVSDSWKNLEIWKGGKKLPTLSAPSLTGCVEGVRLTPPSYQDLGVSPKHAKWLKTAQRVF